jgi:hypothetical protein
MKLPFSRLSSNNVLHHLKDYQIDNLPIGHFKLESKYCRHEVQEIGGGGGGYIFHEDLYLYLFMKILISSLFHLTNTVTRKILRFVP